MNNRFFNVRTLLLGLFAAYMPSVMHADDDVHYVYDYFNLARTSDGFCYFDPTGTGEYLPIVWGIDTAWLSSTNSIRAMRHITPECVDIVRVSYSPYALVTTPGVLPTSLQSTLDRRLAECDRIANARKDGGKPAVMINLDASSPRQQGDYYYVTTQRNENGQTEYVYDLSKGTKNHDEWAKLIHAVVKYIEAKGYEVVSIAPFNEPDYLPNSLKIDHFKAINRFIRQNHPDLNNIRLSGGNTLNTDSAYKWYSYLKEDLEEGNTHELAGTFDNYADFFRTVREDGNWATGDELHNTMECMVGAEYGMQTGIWWGTAERARGEFCQASNTGTRLGYAENRGKWSSASVYKSRGKVQAFVGASERQARPSTYSFVGRRPVFVDGAGPSYGYTIDVPGDPTGAYGTELQRNAEAVFDVTWGEDVRPELDGTYYIINKSSGKAVAFDASKTQTPLVLATYSPGAEGQMWNVGKVPYDNGGDYSYFYINAAKNNGLSWNLYNFGLSDNYEATETRNTVPIWCYPNGLYSNPTRTRDAYDTNMAWWMEYAGDGWFRIVSKYSGYCVKNQQGKSDDGTAMIQAPYNEDDDTQLFRFVKAETAPAVFETREVSAPTNFAASAEGASVRVSWDKPVEADVTGYTLLRAAEDEEEFSTLLKDIKETSVVDNTAVPNHTYRYKVVAFDRSGNRSAATEALEATPVVGDRAMLCSYNFDGNFLDDSGNNFHARSINEPTYVDGHDGTGMALRLQNNSDKFPQLPASAMPQGGAFTVSAWVHNPNTSTTKVGGYVFVFGGDERNSVSLYLFDNESKMKLTVANEGVEKTLTAPAPESKTWHHIAVVFDEAMWQIYVDGEVVASLEEPGLAEYVPYEQMQLNYFGRGYHQSYFDPKNAITITYPCLNAIDNARIYNFALNSAEVISDMTGYVSGVTTTVADAVGSELVSREYFNMKGQRIEMPVDGEPVIVRTRMTDGRVEVKKIAERK